MLTRNRVSRIYYKKKFFDYPIKMNIQTIKNIVPDCWIYVQDVGVKLGRIQIFNNWSPYMVAKPEDTVWIGMEYFCTEGDKYWKLSEEKWARLGAKELVRMGVIDSADQIKDYHKETVKKAYPAYFDTYDHIDDIIEYLNQFENLYCIGRNGQHRYNNMDHSMATAFEAVRNIVKLRLKIICLHYLTVDILFHHC